MSIAESGDFPAPNNTLRETNFPAHYELLRTYAEPIRELSRLENEHYGRAEKPLGMHILFMAAVNVGDAKYQGSNVDVRRQERFFTKPSEIIEAADALQDYYALRDKYQTLGEMRTVLVKALEDKAASAVVELADTLYNSFQIFLNDQNRGTPIMMPFINGLGPDYLDLLFRVAITKFTRRYRENGSKDIAEENSQVRNLLLKKNHPEIFDILDFNRKELYLILGELVDQYRNLAEEEGVGRDIYGEDLLIDRTLLSVYHF